MCDKPYDVEDVAEDKRRCQAVEEGAAEHRGLDADEHQVAWTVEQRFVRDTDGHQGAAAGSKAITTGRIMRTNGRRPPFSTVERNTSMVLHM